VNVMVAQSMLTKLGHVLEVANNGADAIQALQRNSYDLILMVSLFAPAVLFHLD
jgi:CheY-like chemotaxis protein